MDSYDLQGLWSSCWVDMRQVKGWYEHRDLELKGTYNLVEALPKSKVQPK